MGNTTAAKASNWHPAQWTGQVHYPQPLSPHAGWLLVGGGKSNREQTFAWCWCCCWTFCFSSRSCLSCSSWISANDLLRGGCCEALKHHFHNMKWSELGGGELRGRQTSLSASWRFHQDYFTNFAIIILHAQLLNLFCPDTLLLCLPTDLSLPRSNHRKTPVFPIFKYHKNKKQKNTLRTAEKSEERSGAARETILTGWRQRTREPLFLCNKQP